MELLQWAFFDSQEIESWYSSGVKSVCSSIGKEPKNRTPK